MNKKINITEELTRMKSLFDYKRGVVISENFKPTNSANKADYPECVQVFGAPRETRAYSMDYYIFGTGNWDGYKFKSGGDNPEVVKPDGLRDYYFCDSSGLIKIGKSYTQQPTTSPEQAIPASATPSSTKNDTKQSTTHIYSIVQSTDDNCNPGKKYVWKTVRHQYQLEKEPTTPEGSEKTNIMLAKDWKDGWRPMCEKDRKRKEELSKELSKPAEKISYNTNVVQNANNSATTTTQNTAPQVKTQITQKTLPNVQDVYAQQIANETPEQLYSRLYKAGVVKGDPQKQGRVRFIMPSGAQPLTQDQVNKLNEYMNSIGYEYYRKRNRDGGLVYTPVYQEQQD